MFKEKVLKKEVRDYTKIKMKAKTMSNNISAFSLHDEVGECKDIKVKINLNDES